MFVSSLFDTEKKKKKNFGEFFKEALYLGTQIKKKGTEGRDLLGGDFEFDGCVVVFLSHGFSITIDEAEKKKIIIIDFPSEKEGHQSPSLATFNSNSRWQFSMRIKTSLPRSSSRCRSLAASWRF